MTTFDAPRLAQAESFAVQAHADQRYGPHPYRYHLLSVANIAREFGVLDEDIHVAAWLHDSVEDTAMTRAQIVEVFGARVGDLVWGVTDEPGATRRIRHGATYPKTASIPGAVILKLCDRMANTRECLKATTERSQRKLQMYRAEYALFRQLLHTNADGVEARLWDALDVLSAWDGKEDAG